MADQERSPAGLTPQELMARSNPGLFDRDLTNPREVYNMLSTKHKPFVEDVVLKVKNESTSNAQAQATNVFPQLYRTTSMNEIKRPNAKAEKLGLFQSATDLFSPRRHMNVMVLTRNRTSIEDLRRVDVSTEEKENTKTLNLPNITRNSASQENSTQNPHDNVALPDVTNGHHYPRLNEEDEDKENGENTASPKKKRTRIRDTNVPSDAKLDKWFSEMPNEVFDKAQRAIMEESIKDKLTQYQQKRGKKDKIPTSSFVKSKRVPNTFLELRVDSFGRHLQVDPSKEKLSRYILQQKSLHKLKMREVDGGEKAHGDDFESPRIPCAPQRTHTNLTKKTTVEEKPKKFLKPSSPDKSLKTVNMNDVALNGAMKPNPRIVLSKFEEIYDRFNVYRATPEENHQNGIENCGRPSEDHHGVHEADFTDKDLAKASIVNLALRKATPKKRHPIHIAQSMTLAGTLTRGHQENHSDDGLNESDSNDEQEDDETRMKNKTGHIFATIPTAKSTRTNDSKSTSSSTKSQPKEVLKKFNRLEVFSENAPTDDCEANKPMFKVPKRRETEAKPLHYKLDLKQYPSRSPFTNGELIQSEVRVQEVVFRFEPGEVYITRKNNLAAGRSSERARIIFGKALGKDDRRDEFRRSKDNHSMKSFKTGTTKLENYTSEMAKFESRALADSTTSLDRPDEQSSHRVLPSAAADGEEEGRDTGGGLYVVNRLEETPSVATVNTRGKLVRDMAIETDILGPEEVEDKTERAELNGELENKPEAEVLINGNATEVRLSDEDRPESGEDYLPEQESAPQEGVDNFKSGMIEHEEGIVIPMDEREKAYSSVSDYIKNDDTGEGLDSDEDDTKSGSISFKIDASDRGTSAG